MKKSITTFKCLSSCFCTMLIAAGMLISFTAFSQTDFYNGGVNVTVYPNTVLYVGGNVINDPSGLIHNQGDIYLTGDWTNNEPSGCLDPTTGNVILYGAAQAIMGSQTTTFNTLDCQGVGTKTLNVNTVVGGTTGALALHSDPFDLNKNTFIITNPSPSAITRTSGYIISETDPTMGYGKIQWNIGTNSGNYTYPFGTVSGSYIPFDCNITTIGTQSGTGNISAATYPTSVTGTPNNRPLPTGVSNLDDKDGLEADTKCADRFWVLDAPNYSTKPTADLSFTYLDSEWDGTSGSTNNIVEDSLRGWLWDGTQWQNPPVGTVNISTNKVSVTSVNTFVPWTLRTSVPQESCGDFKVPNAFSPNGDGHSDYFVLHGWPNCVSTFSFVVFDRWGEKVYETDNPGMSWDGTYKGKTLDPAVFVYYINAQLNSGEKMNKKGNITLIR